MEAGKSNDRWEQGMALLWKPLANLLVKGPGHEETGTREVWGKRRFSSRLRQWPVRACFCGFREFPMDVFTWAGDMENVYNIFV
ncbi:MAG TPA: hypothetical protein DDZ83_11700 [Nitrospinae bacterium]|nr:hypothetical protein [Nitrospinota bacterium]